MILSMEIKDRLWRKNDNQRKIKGNNNKKKDKSKK